MRFPSGLAEEVGERKGECPAGDDPGSTFSLGTRRRDGRVPASAAGGERGRRRRGRVAAVLGEERPHGPARERERDVAEREGEFEIFRM